MAMTKRYDHANEERYGAAIEALDAAGKTSCAEALGAARWTADRLDVGLTPTHPPLPPALASVGASRARSRHRTKAGPPLGKRAERTARPRQSHLHRLTRPLKMAFIFPILTFPPLR